MGANKINTQPITHTHSFKLTQMVCNATHRLPEAQARANCLPAAHRAANAAITPPIRGVRF